jgi:pyruvate/2-oxoglutarate dehydrogenase complex dihydrolipoamide acyltransferase (E2) component
MTKKSKIKNSEFGTYYTIPFSRNREIVVDFLRLGKKSMKVYAIGDIDVTYPLQTIRELKEKGVALSFSAYLTHAFVKTIAEHPRMQAIRWRRRKMVVFEDVDVSFLVEREIKGKKIPTMVIIRKANNKSIKEITEEIWGAKNDTDEGMVDEESADTNKLLKLPGFLRRFIFNRFFKNPFLRRKYNGTIGITSVGMFTGGGGTSVPIAIENLTLNAGGIEKRPGYRVKENGEYDTTKVIPRDYLWLTIAVDHTTVDGGPIARFLAVFRERVRNGFGLDEIKTE